MPEQVDVHELNALTGALLDALAPPGTAAAFRIVSQLALAALAATPAGETSAGVPGYAAALALLPDLISDFDGGHDLLGGRHAAPVPPRTGRHWLDAEVNPDLVARAEAGLAALAATPEWRRLGTAGRRERVRALLYPLNVTEDLISALLARA